MQGARPLTISRRFACLLVSLRGRLVLLALLAAGIAPAAQAQKLTGAGATFPNPIYSKWFDAYNKKTGIQINYQSIGSGGGIRQYTEGTVDFGATDGPMNESQIQAVDGNVVHIPTVLGAVVRHLQSARRSARRSSSSTATPWSTSSWAGSPSGMTSGCRH